MNDADIIKRCYPDYFDRYHLPPEGAKEEEITVFRACKSGKCDKTSFMSTFEEKGSKYDEDDDPTNPSLYSLSTYENPKDVRRFASMTNEYSEPYAIARGITNPRYGVCQRTRERTGKKTSHVDWWLYVNARPYEEFSLIADFGAFLEKYKKNE